LDRIWAVTPEEDRSVDLLGRRWIAISRNGVRTAVLLQDLEGHEVKALLPTRTVSRSLLLVAALALVTSACGGSSFGTQTDSGPAVAFAGSAVSIDSASPLSGAVIVLRGTAAGSSSVEVSGLLDSSDWRPSFYSVTTDGNAFSVVLRPAPFSTILIDAGAESTLESVELTVDGEVLQFQAEAAR
jgi:hypothetical protein